MAQVARIMPVRGARGMNRQVFFAVTGGFDNHEQLVSKQAQLMADVNSPFAAFFSTLQTTGMMNNVTLFTESEFNRMGNSNTNVEPAMRGTITIW